MTKQNLTFEEFPQDPLPGDLLRARDCLLAAGEVWPVPEPLEDKYAGVVGVYAGSDMYPGAALMTLRAAVRSTSPLVRYAGPVDPRLVALALPEVVSAPGPQQAGRVQSWVGGPGIDVDSDTSAEAVDWLLRQRETLLLDASALRILAADQSMLSLLADRRKVSRWTVLTPHAGEFAALAEALGSPKAAAAGAADQPFDERRRACAWVARQLNCVVVLKGRVTVVSDDEAAWGVDAEHSWSATAGSGDVLAGITGAVIAATVDEQPLLHSVVGAVGVHAMAALAAAEGPEGAAPVPATDIADHIHAVVAIALRQADDDAQANVEP